MPVLALGSTIFFLPLTLFAVLALFHNKLPRHGDLVATGGIGVAFLASLLILGSALGSPDNSFFHHWTFNWIPVSGVKALTGGILIDGFTAIMLVVVTLVSFLVHLFSTKYLENDVRYGRYFTCLLLFTTSMLGLVLADNLLFLFVFWELVGLSSYTLIGHWFEKKSASDAAIKAFITTRIGDVGMLLGLLIVYWKVGSLQYVDIFAAVGELNLFGVGVDKGFLGFDWQTLAGLGLFLGAMGKSAQFPFHVWLPDAMEGPTPVSALIHAATMVVAGVYLVGRLFPMFTPDTFIFIAYIGGITALFAASIATVQDDIKKVLAYSTLSQLGYMILALGVGGYVSGIYHLATHAFFKAGLFLGSGSIIYAMHHEQRMSKYGGLWHKMPVTAWTYLICVLAISGVPFFAGFYSKDAILADTLYFVLQNPQHAFLAFSGFFTALLTAFYMFRQFFLTFTGKPRDQEKYDHAHESPRQMTVPLVILAALAILAGGFGFVKPVVGNILPPRDAAEVVFQYSEYHADAGSVLGPVASFAVASEALRVHEHHVDHDVEHKAHTDAMTWSIVLAALGILWAGAFYWEGRSGKPFANKELAVRAIRPLHTLLWNKYYFDELYHYTLIAVTFFFTRLMAAFDRWVLDMIVNGVGWAGLLASRVTGVLLDNWGVDGVVNGVARGTGVLGNVISYSVSGKLRHYLLYIAIGVISLSILLVAVT